MLSKVHANADPNVEHSADGRTAMDFAACAKRTDIIDVLRRAQGYSKMEAGPGGMGFVPKGTGKGKRK